MRREKNKKRGKKKQVRKEGKEKKKDTEMKNQPWNYYHFRHRSISLQILKDLSSTLVFSVTFQKTQ